jgi:penicillin-binding protein 1A
MLAGLLKAPSYYAPTNKIERAREPGSRRARADARSGLPDRCRVRRRPCTPAKLSQAAQARAGGYFADWVMETGPAFLTNDTTEDVVIARRWTRMQKQAEQALADVFSSKVKDGSKAEAAIVVMSADGAVRAMVGGREPAGAGAFNRATQALRQTGSTFKPFVYAVAIDQGYTMNTMSRMRRCAIYVKGSGDWCAQEL